MLDWCWVLFHRNRTKPCVCSTDTPNVTHGDSTTAMATAPDSQTPIEGLLEKLRQGDSSARGLLIDHACDRLRRLTRRMLRSYPSVRRWSETDDVLQQAMIRLHRSLSQVFPGDTQAFLGLAATQIRRELIDLARHFDGPQGHAANHHTDAGEAVENYQAAAGEPASLCDWTAFHEQVGRLPEPDRQVFELLWYRGLSQPEAAAELGISLATLKRRWQSARLALQEAHDGEFPTL